MAIRFYNNDTSFLPSNRIKIKTWLTDSISKEGYTLESASFIFCSDEALLEMNKQYLQHDYFTDIITFDLREDYTQKAIHGEMYISIDRVRENAKNRAIKITDELHRVMLHGLLHLMGYGDKNKTEEKIMRAKEDFYLNKRAINA